MRTWLLWLLLASLLSAAIAIGWPDAVSDAVVRTQTALKVSDATASVQTPARPEDTGQQRVLPSALPTTRVGLAVFDPFVGMQPPPQPPTPLPTPSPPAVAAPPPAPTAPALGYRYLGQMTDPNGKRLVYLAKADKELPVAAGMLLDEGYVVESIGADGVHLFYPPLDVRAIINIPPNNGSVAP